MTTAISPYNRPVEPCAIFELSSNKAWAALGASCANLLVSSGAAVAAGIGHVYKWATEDPNTVQTIYTPPHPSKEDLLKLLPHAEKIAELKTHPEVMGITFAPNENNELTPIYIVSGQTLFSAYDLANGKQLGFASTLPFLKSNEYHKTDHWEGPRPEEYDGYGSSEEEVGKVLLEQVTNRSKYKNIGVILNKAIHQKFEEECQGRILIDAVRKTQPYHYKMGFRSSDPKKNKLYAWHVKKHQIPKKDLGSVYMYLPDQARQLWLNEVREYPIRFPS